MPKAPAKKARKTANNAAAKPAAKVARKLVAKVDPTKPHAARADSGASTRRPAIQALIRRAQGSLPMAMLRRFIDADLLAQSAALAFYAVLSLAPLLLILLWLTAQFMPGTQDAFMQQVVLLGGGDAERLARAVIANAQARPDGGAIAGWKSLAFLFVGATAVFAQLQDVLNKIFRTDATRLPGAMAWLRKRVFSLGLVLALGFLLLVSMPINTVLQFAFARVEWMLPLMASVAAWTAGRTPTCR